MKKLLFFSLVLLLLVSLSGCSEEKLEHELPEMIEVVLTVTPESGQVNEPVTLEAKVTQGEENVEDAKEVKFEIWRANDEKHEEIEIEHAEDGVYRLEKTFQQEGTYYIISHVTARDMHNMPKEEFIIGTPSEPEESKDSMEHMDMDE
ncbi:FixH family protein [Neobacillus sp. FSL H8-0543]|uniref:FixH family protein n=1 Tax=Neobacillus sp. FSL H8-0543 TaxID=2954672 RepID=UPI0031582BB3